MHIIHTYATIHLNSREMFARLADQNPTGFCRHSCLAIFAKGNLTVIPKNDTLIFYEEKTASHWH